MTGHRIYGQILGEFVTGFRALIKYIEEKIGDDIAKVSFRESRKTGLIFAVLPAYWHAVVEPGCAHIIKTRQLNADWRYDAEKHEAVYVLCTPENRGDKGSHSNAVEYVETEIGAIRGWELPALEKE